MSLIPEEHFSPKLGFNFAPMVDFLFIVVAVFAFVVMTRKALYDSSVHLVNQENQEASSSPPSSHTVNLAISSLGEYKWLSVNEYQILDSIEKVKKELITQIEQGKLSSDRSKNQILLHIDQKAEWQPIAKLIFAMHEEGFSVYPVYEKKPFILKN